LDKFVQTTIFVILLVMLNLAYSQIPFNQKTFDDFAYINGVYDDEYSLLLEGRSNYSFPNSEFTKVASYVTRDNSRDVVNYYAQKSGQRFERIGEKFIYIFSKINEAPANRIEIQPIPHLRIPKALWPTRINLYIITYDIKDFLPTGQGRSIEDLRKLAGRLTYDGTMRDDVANLEQVELGADGNCFIIETKDSWEMVYQFFRRRYGRLDVRPARDGDVWVRNFEFDGTNRAGLDREKLELFIRVDENPIIRDQHGNAQVFSGSTFIKYTFWKNVGR
jgi:hypothetical protein